MTGYQGPEFDSADWEAEAGAWQEVGWKGRRTGCAKDSA